jgi:dienelactone hydrolase
VAYDLEPHCGVVSKATLTVFVLALAVWPSGVHGQTRLQMLPIETVTLNSQQILIGEKNGKQTVLAGELLIPAVAGRVPAVILIHGSDGLNSAIERWAQELNQIGVAAFLFDCFSGRSITSTVGNQSQLHNLTMMVDAYKALGVLTKHPRLDANRIAIMGFSKGAFAAVYSSNERFRKLYAPADGSRFAAHVGLYAPCNVTYRDDDKTTGAPIRLFHGIADDWVAIGPCREYVSRLRKAGVDITLTEYPGAQHGYDFFFLGTEPATYSNATTTRNCRAEEGEHGLIMNSKTAKPYDVNQDACVEKGPHLGYNEAATAATTKAIKEFLTTQLKLKR